MNTAITTYRPGLLGRSVFDDIFDSMLDIPALVNRTTQGYPVADIYRGEKDETIMEFALAGFERENLNVEIFPDKRSIEVSADSHGDEESPGFTSRRIARRTFHKSYVNYDNNLDLNAATATFKNGLLRIVVPRRAELEPVKVEIS